MTDVEEHQQPQHEEGEALLIPNTESALEGDDVVGTNEDGKTTTTINTTTPPTADITTFDTESARCLLIGKPDARTSNVIIDDGDGKIKRARRPYCPHESVALIEGVKRYGGSARLWSRMLKDEELLPMFHDRSTVDLKDKWRVLTKRDPSLLQIRVRPTKARKARVSKQPRAVVDENVEQNVNSEQGGGGGVEHLSPLTQLTAPTTANSTSGNNEEGQPTTTTSEADYMHVVV